MKKLISYAVVGLLAAVVVVSIRNSRNQEPNELFLKNIEALADDGEYHQGTTGTNWKTYTITCIAYGPSYSDSDWSWYQSIGAYVAGTGGEVGSGGGHGSGSGTVYGPITFYKDRCGKGAGFCLDSAPSGHPCQG